jgi:hypothetical protein
MNLTELQTITHQTAIAKGWHESSELDTEGKPTARQKLSWLALVTDELDEADDEIRCFYLDENGKPCGISTEYADAQVRVADAMGALGFELGPTFSNPLPVHRARTLLVAAIRTGADNRDHWNELFHAIGRRATVHIGEEKLAFALEAKMTYNETRPHRHGGKLA